MQKNLSKKKILLLNKKKLFLKKCVKSLTNATPFVFVLFSFVFAFACFQKQKKKQKKKKHMKKNQKVISRPFLIL